MVEVPIQLNSGQVYWSEETFADCALHVRPGTAATYREADVWKKFLRIEDDFTTGVDEVVADGEACIRLTNGGLVLGGGAWTVCTPNGQCVARGTGSETLHLPAGIYVVRCGKAAKTVVVQ